MQNLKYQSIQTMNIDADKFTISISEINLNSGLLTMINF